MRLFGQNTPQWVQAAYYGVARWVLPSFMRMVSNSWVVHTAYLPESTWQYLHTGEPCVFALWHGQMFSLLMQAPDVTKTGVLISPSRDGRFMSEVFKGLGGAKLIIGSKGRDGEKATREMLHYLEEQGQIAMMVDGPRGPGYQAKTGIIKLASLAQVPIIPIVAEAHTNRMIAEEAWDRFVAPLWGARIVYGYGEPFMIPPKLSREESAIWANLLTSKMKALSQKW
ncbi:MAG: lysophospholipid acyltransferase family protein [Vampirovibrionales bacterium]